MLLKNLSKVSSQIVSNKNSSGSVFVLFNNFYNKNLNNQQIRNASAFKFVPETAPSNLGETTKMNLCQSITNALDLTLASDKSSGKLDIKKY